MPSILAHRTSHHLAPCTLPHWARSGHPRWGRAPPTLTIAITINHPSLAHSRHRKGDSGRRQAQSGLGNRPRVTQTGTGTGRISIGIDRQQTD
eukprot:scaffold23226_cov85-Isochrysis_galbana.AAC.2